MSSVRKNLSLIILITYPFIAIIVRNTVPSNTDIYKVILFLVPLITIALASFTHYFVRGNDIDVPSISGTRGNEELIQFLTRMQGMLQDDIREIRVSNKRLQEEILQLQMLINELKKNNNRSQFLSIGISFVLGCIGTLILSGVPNPLNIWFK